MSIVRSGRAAAVNRKLTSAYTYYSVSIRIEEQLCVHSRLDCRSRCESNAPADISVMTNSIASLAQLYQRTRYLDSQVDSGVETNTTLRQAWREARENVDREAEARGALVNALKAEILTPLVMLKVGGSV